MLSHSRAVSVTLSPLVRPTAVQPVCRLQRRPGGDGQGVWRHGARGVQNAGEGRRARAQTAQTLLGERLPR